MRAFGFSPLVSPSCFCMQLKLSCHDLLPRPFLAFRCFWPESLSSESESERVIDLVVGSSSSESRGCAHSQQSLPQLREWLTKCAKAFASSITWSKASFGRSLEGSGAPPSIPWLQDSSDDILSSSGAGRSDRVSSVREGVSGGLTKAPLSAFRAREPTELGAAEATESFAASASV